MLNSWKMDMLLYTYNKRDGLYAVSYLCDRTEITMLSLRQCLMLFILYNFLSSYFIGNYILSKLYIIIFLNFFYQGGTENIIMHKKYYYV